MSGITPGQCDPIVHGGMSGSSGSLLVCYPPPHKNIAGPLVRQGAMINRDFVCLIACVCTVCLR